MASENKTEMSAVEKIVYFLAGSAIPGFICFFGAKLWMISVHVWKIDSNLSVLLFYVVPFVWGLISSVVLGALLIGGCMMAFNNGQSW